MKIAILGFSGSGKSTLAKALGERYRLPVLYLDTIQFLPGWKERDKQERLELLQSFLDENDEWVIDGNYTSVLFDTRMELAERIVLLNFNRFACLYRVVKRFLQNRNRPRESMADGCNEKLDFEFIFWVLFKGRAGKRRRILEGVASRYPEKVTVIKNQRELDRYLK